VKPPVSAIVNAKGPVQTLEQNGMVDVIKGCREVQKDQGSHVAIINSLVLFTNRLSCLY